MPGVNTTGIPNTNDYNLGRGIVYFAALDSGGLPLGFRDLGNAPEFNISFETETLEHQSSRQGLKVTDKEVVISQKCKLSLTLDEINFDNLAIGMSGTALNDQDINLYKVGVTDAVIVSAANYVQNRWYDLRDPTTGKRAFNITNVAHVVVKHNAGITTLTQGTDYTLDAKMGRIFVNIASVTTSLTFTLTLNAGAVPIDVVRALVTSSLSGALKFIASNPADGDKYTEYLFHKVSLKPQGDLALIGDDWSKMQLEGVAESNTAADSASPICTIRTFAQ